LREKLLVRQPWPKETVFGMRYDDRERELMIGGPRRFRIEMEKALVCIGVKTVRGRWSFERWRCVAVYALGPVQWERGKARLRVGGRFTMEKVRAFRRLMR
jgi:hypothetical protein